MICRKTMQECKAPNMCAPFEGCAAPISPSTTTGCLSAEDREELDAVFIAHLRAENATLQARAEQAERAVDVLEAALREIERVGKWSGTDGLEYTSQEGHIARAALESKP